MPPNWRNTLSTARSSCTADAASGWAKRWSDCTAICARCAFTKGRQKCNDCWWGARPSEPMSAAEAGSLVEGKPAALVLRGGASEGFPYSRTRLATFDGMRAKPRLLQSIRAILRLRHFASRTEEAYFGGASICALLRAAASVGAWRNGDHGRDHRDQKGSAVGTHAAAAMGVPSGAPVTHYRSGRNNGVIGCAGVRCGGIRGVAQQVQK